MKIGSKLILIIGLLVIISVTISGIIYYFLSKQSIEERTKAQLESVIILKENQFNNFIEESVQDIEGLTIEKLFISNFIKMQEAHINEEALVMAHHENVKQLLRERLAYKKNFFEFFVMSMNGRIHMSTNDTQREKIRSNENYFIEGKKHLYLQNFYFDSVLHEPAVTIATPIRDHKEEIIGVLAGRINLEKISEIMTEKSGLGKTGEAYLVNKFNLLVSKSLFMEEIEFKTIIHSQGVQDCLIGNYGYHFNNYRNIDVIGIHRWIPEREVCLIVEIGQKEIFELVEGSKNIIFAINVGIIIFAILSGIFLAKTITMPIKQLTITAQAIAGGDLTRLANIKSKDEIKILADSFNKMMISLKQGYNELDISRKEEKAIKEKLEVIMKSIGEGILVVDINKKILLFNQAAEKISGWKFEEAENKSCAEVFKTRDAKDKINIRQKFCPVDEVLKTSKIVLLSNNVCLLSKQGRRIPVAGSVTPIINAQDKVMGAVVIFRNVAKEREIDRAKSEFVSLASHQLRTPLAGIKWFVELLSNSKAGKLNKKQIDYLQQISISNRRMIRLVDDLLNISHIEEGEKFKINKQEIDVKKIIDQSFTNNAILAEKRGVKLIKIAIKTQKEFKISSDLDKIRQVFNNLIDNAIKYTKKKGTVEIAYHKKDNEIIFSIKDDGIGIPDDQQHKIFKKFFRADNAVLEETEGNGLGLYIAKSIVEAHRGKIWFESKEGKGTTFYFSLPI